MRSFLATNMEPRIGFLLVVVLVSCSILKTEAVCPAEPNYREENGICYLLVDRSLTRDEAGDYCRSNDGIVARIPDRTTQDIMVDFMQSKDWRRMWTGLTESNTPWRWVNDNSLISYQGCFDDSSDTLIDDWFDRDDDWVPETCIENCKNLNSSWEYAGIKRSGSGVIICACISDFSLESQVTSGCNDRCLKDGYTDQYCGGIDRMQVYKIGGLPLNGWYVNQPNNNSDYQSCMSLNPDSFKWGDEECHGNEASSVTYSHFCEYELEESSCESAGHDYDDASGKCISQHRNSRLSWFNARLDCVENGGDLVKIDTQEAQDFIVKEINADGSRWWVGGTNRKWTWDNGEELLYNYFAPDHPEFDSEDCVMIYINGGNADNYGWVTERCNKDHPFVCEINSPTTTTTTTSAPTTIITTTTSAPTTTTTSAPTTTTTSAPTTSSTTSTTPIASTTTTTTEAPTTTKPLTDPPTTAAPTTTSTTTTVTPLPSTSPSTSTRIADTSTERSTTNGQLNTDVATTHQASSTSEQQSSSTSSPTQPTSPVASPGSPAGQDDDDDDDDDLETGVIIAIVVAAVAVFAGTIRLCVYCCQRRSGKHGERLTNESNGSDRDPKPKTDGIDNTNYTEPVEDSSQSHVNMTYAY